MKIGIKNKNKNGESEEARAAEAAAEAEKRKKEKKLDIASYRHSVAAARDQRAYEERLIRERENLKTLVEFNEKTPTDLSRLDHISTMPLLRRQ